MRTTPAAAALDPALAFPTRSIWNGVGNGKTESK